MKTWHGFGIAAIAVLSGCGDDPTTEGPTVVVERWDAVEGCFATCPGQAPLSPGLQVAEPCATPAQECGFLGGEDTLRVIVDLGDVDVPRVAALEAPRLDLVLDGEARLVQGAFPPRVPGAERAHFTGVVDVPAEEARSFAVRVDFGSGFGAETPAFDILPPVVDLVAHGCEVPGCALEAGVGELVVSVSAPRGLDATAFVSTTLAGVPQSAIAELTLSAIEGARRTGTTKLPVPALEGAPWSLRARVGAFSSGPLQVELAPLSLGVDLPACAQAGGATCSLEAGTTTSLVISAPAGVLDRSATISAKLDGLLAPGTFEIDLDSVEGDRRLGAASVTLPSAPGKSWQLVVRVGESVRAGALIAIAPPSAP